MRVISLCILAVALSGCQLIYKLPTRQGNIIDQKDVDRLQVGMTREQVQYVMGTPIATTPFRDDRWEYFGYYKSPRGDVVNRTVTLFFEGDKLTRLQGVQAAANDYELSGPNVKTIAEQEKRRQDNERSRASTSAPPTTTPQGSQQ